MIEMTEDSGQKTGNAGLGIQAPARNRGLACRFVGALTNSVSPIPNPDPYNATFRRARASKAACIGAKCELY